MRFKKLFLTAATILIVTQGCRKTAPVTHSGVKTGPVTAISASSGLRLNATGDYGAYQIINASNNQSAQVTNFSLVTGGTCNLAAYTTEPHQQWRITNKGGGYFTLMNHGSGKFVQAYNHKGNLVVIQNNENKADSQLWKLMPVGNKTYRAISKINGLAITANGKNPCVLEAYTGKTSQLWGYNALPASSYRDDEVTRFFQRTRGTQAWDGNMSVKLTYGENKGKVLWVTNDEYYNQLDANGRIKCYGTNVFFSKNNAALLQPENLSWDPLLTNNYFVTSRGRQYGEEVFHDFSGKVLWPGNGVEVGNKIYISNIQVQGLTLTGQYMGVINQADKTSVLLTIPGLSDQPLSGAIEYSIGMVKDGDYVYNYGKRNNNVYVARFPRADPLIWTFWDGTKWAGKPSTAQAARLLSGLPSGGINVAKVKGKFVLISHDFGFGCDGGRNFYTWTSAGPNVPFAGRKTVFKRTDYKNGHLPVFYTPIMHPDIDNGKNELLVTYCVNFYGNCIPLCSEGGTEDPDGYRPKAFRIPYSLIGL